MSPPWKRKPMRPKLAAPWSIDAALRAEVAARAGHACECCGEALGRSWEAHHRKLRSQGGQDSICNLVALCMQCHTRIHNRRVWSEEHGFIVESHQDPAKRPVKLRCERWVRLRVDGSYAPARKPAA